MKIEWMIKIEIMGRSIKMRWMERIKRTRIRRMEMMTMTERQERGRNALEGGMDIVSRMRIVMIEWDAEDVEDGDEE